MFSLSSQSPEFLSGIHAAPKQVHSHRQGSTDARLARSDSELNRPETQARLLYIEDNLVNQLLVEELTAMRPAWRLELAGDGAQGLSRAASFLPDLILLDLELPDMNGFQVLEALRASAATAHIPCIALSANAMPEDLRRAKAAGFSDYWTKPVDFKAFHAGLDQFLAELAQRAECLKPAASPGS